MIRSFLPVGQGAFYCECFSQGAADDKINIIYDCGSLTDVKIVERAISNNFQKKEIIDALFISHLDEDHINGIPFLLKYCRVKRIYFPIITEKNKAIIRVHQSINSTRNLNHAANSFTLEFLENPRNAVRNLGVDYPTEFIQIEETEQENYEQDIARLNIRRMRSGDNAFEDISMAKADKAIYSRWLYIPFNFRQQEKLQRLMDNLEIQFGRRIMEKEVEQIWLADAPGDRDRIKAAYEAVPGTLNTNSMTLFSGETDYGFRQFIYGNTGKFFPKCHRCFHKPSGCSDRPSGCLYTGDYDASGKRKWAQLKSAYKDYWEHIGCVQIPHHGSRHNFNNEFLDLDAFFIISAGYVNRHQHPHASVIKAFLLRHITPYIVTEQAGSAMYFWVG